MRVSARPHNAYRISGTCARVLAIWFVASKVPFMPYSLGSDETIELSTVAQNFDGGLDIPWNPLTRRSSGFCLDGG